MTFFWENATIYSIKNHFYIGGIEMKMYVDFFRERQKEKIALLSAMGKAVINGELSAEAALYGLENEFEFIIPDLEIDVEIENIYFKDSYTTWMVADIMKSGIKEQDYIKVQNAVSILDEYLEKTEYFKPFCVEE